MNLAEKIKAIRKTTGKSQQGFASLIGVGKSKIAHLEAGNTNELTPELLELMVIKLNINKNWILNGEGEMYNKNDIKTEEPDKKELDSMTPVNDFVELPYFHSGIPDDFALTPTTKKVYTREAAKDANFLIRTTDNSMSNYNIYENYNLLVKKQEFLDKDGDLMVLSTKEDSLICRRVKYNDKGAGYILEPANQDEKEITLLPDECKFVGKITRIFFDV